MEDVLQHYTEEIIQSYYKHRDQCFIWSKPAEKSMIFIIYH